jgi:riboflavin synthase
MFGGIVTGIGRVEAVGKAPGAARTLTIDVSCLARRPKRGDSVSVAGTCLTVVALKGRHARFDVVGETIRRTTLGALAAGDAVNLEGALRLGDEIGGHQVSGHVDGVGVVRAVDRRRDETRVTIEAPAAVHDTLVEKGFVAVDGASLTVASVGRGTFDVALIPATLAITTLGRLASGARVNLEGDALGKHVAAWLAARFVRTPRRGSPRTRAPARSRGRRPRRRRAS